MKEPARILVLFEEMNGKFDAILEYVKDIPDMRLRLGRLEDRMDGVELDLTVIKSLVKQSSADIRQLKAQLQ
ncbi:MAG TPA: hypothetical protein VMT30_07035 [Candidatus Saccharimonadia bacterium]|nr:hypothetical protein [Candidatus Saccharimonadia bacterium]